MFSSSQRNNREKNHQKRRPPCRWPKHSHARRDTSTRLTAACAARNAYELANLSPCNSRGYAGPHLRQGNIQANASFPSLGAACKIPQEAAHFRYTVMALQKKKNASLVMLPTPRRQPRLSMASDSCARNHDTSMSAIRAKAAFHDRKKTPSRT
ncbi:hypothetical protein TcCL_NonESM05576 [Trypanosoma cruzi]|nr:hypothetical protein TcCL_NonESM05576 [Trypanosoma cruzi]